MSVRSENHDGSLIKYATACLATNFLTVRAMEVFEPDSVHYDPMDRSPPGSSVHGILQARMLEWGAMPSSRASFWLRDRTCISYVSCTGRAGSLPLVPARHIHLCKCVLCVCILCGKGGLAGWWSLRGREGESFLISLLESSGPMQTTQDLLDLCLLIKCKS